MVSVTPKYEPAYSHGQRIEALESLDNHAQITVLIDILFECSTPNFDTQNRHFIFTLELQQQLLEIRGS